jgi:hypothetical protein
MDEKTEELRQIFVEAADEDTVTESQQATHGSLTEADDDADERLESVIAEMQEAYEVSAVSPNPVKTTGTVSVTVREAQEVEVGVYNVLGQRVATLHDGSLPAEDPTTLTVGSALPSGVYFVRVNGESFSTTQKFVRVR